MSCPVLVQTVMLCLLTQIHKAGLLNQTFLFFVCQAPVKYSVSDSEDEFDDVGKESAPKRKPVISDDDDSFLPEPMADREVDSPVPSPKAPEPA